MAKIIEMNEWQFKQLMSRRTNFELRKLLEHYGYRRVPTRFRKKEEKIAKCVSLWQEDVQKMSTAYSIAVLGNQPRTDHAAARVDDPDPDKILVAVKEVVNEKWGDIASEKLDAALVPAIDSLKKEIADLSKEVGKTKKVEHHIKIGKSRAIKVEEHLPQYFQHLLGLIQCRMNIMLAGPTGCGKTHVVGMAAKVLKMRYSSLSCSIGMTESKLDGWLLPTGAGGKFEYSMSQFVDMYENGGIFLLDEIDASDANTLVFINQAIAQDHFFLAKRGVKKARVNRHPDFVCIAAANTYGNGADMMFVGRNQLDAATLDRFRSGMITVDYDPVVEEALVDPEVLEWGRVIRRKIADRSLRRAMSTRVMLDFTKQKEVLGYGRDKWEESYYADWTEQERRSMV